ncbi:MAG: restriction endonuclease subunit S [Methylococcales bacterium]|nr:restriction endonuclease subunit S [Methylococcales bacterium]
MNKRLRQIGIVNDSYELLTVADLIKLKIIEKPLDGNHGEIHPKGEDFVDFGVPFIMASDIKDGRVDYSGCKYISEKQTSELRKGFAKNGDVLVTHKASIGRTAIVDYQQHPYVMLTPQVTYYRILNPKKLNNRYLRHYFDSDIFQKTLQIWAGAGSTRAYLGITGQHKLPVIIPSIETQKKIAAILSAYDDLIENNKRRIALLEKMAEEIYREWFVRFRFPGYQAAEFEKGIPKGWMQGSLGGITNMLMGQSPKSEFYNDSGNGLPFHQGVGSYGDRFPKNETFCSVDGRTAKGGDILFSVRAPVGRLNIANTIMIIGRGLAALSHKKEFNSYLFYLLKVAFSNEDIIGNGSIFNSVGKDELNGFKLLMPPNTLVKEFDQKASEIDKQISLLILSVENLTQTKQVLLPRLISGKLSVEDLDIQFPPSMQEDRAA